MRRRTWSIVSSASLLLSSFPSLAQALAQAPTQSPTQTAVIPDPSAPAFEVASIRIATPDSNRKWFGIKLDLSSGRFEAASVPLSTLVYVAYAAKPERAKVDIAHAAPKWIGSDEFDVEARVDAAYMGGWKDLSHDQQMVRVRPMLQRLLAERFHLKLAVESRMTPVYALIQAKGGAHVKEVPPPALGSSDPSQGLQRWSADNPGKIYPGYMVCSGSKCTGHAIPISDAIGQIAASSHADRMVIDQTGLTGFYDLSFTFPNEKVEFPMQEVESDLGMRFKPTSQPVKTYVILSADRPSVD